MADTGRRRPPLVAQRRYPPAGSGEGRSATPARKGMAKPRGRKPAPPPPRRRRGPVGWILALVGGFLWLVWRILWGMTWRLGMVFGLIVGLAVAYYAVTLPPASQLVDGRARGSVTLLDRHGQVFAWRGDQFGGVITADQVSPYLHDAIIATEDRRFYRHLGIDPRGIASAVRINLRDGRGPFSGHGGSTITQQTAKLLCLGRPFDPRVWESEAAYEADCRRTTMWRKAQEAVFALAMEVRYTKAEILTIYLNRAYLGSGARGFEAAAQRYFGRSSNQVSPAEAAMLAGLLQAPSALAPTRNLARAQNRANVVVGLMEDQGFLTAAAAEDARVNPARLSQAAEARSGGAFADWVMDAGPQFFTRHTTEDVIIRTTLDPRIQSAAEEALVNVFETRVREGSEAQAAIVVMSADGAVRAMVGGRNLRAAGAFNRATQALRQTGSSFKPFVFAAALDLGMSPLDRIDDTPLTINVVGSGPWSPQNYDREFKGSITLTQALAESRNIPAVRLSEMVGRDAVRLIASDFGIDSDLASGPALALGASESTLLEMTGAYAGILNGGSSVMPYGLIELRLQGDENPLMGSAGGIGERVVLQDAALQLTWMLYQVVEAGTGQRARIPGWEIAGKTGTTQGTRDAWFIGFSAEYVVGVWMGNDDNAPLTGVTGGGLPATIFHEVMVRVLQGHDPVPLPMLPPAGPSGTFVNPGGLLAEGTGNFPADPFLDSGSVSAAPAPAGQGDRSEQAILDALSSILGGQ